jgi:hypothetical protein
VLLRWYFLLAVHSLKIYLDFHMFTPFCTTDCPSRCMICCFQLSKTVDIWVILLRGFMYWTVHLDARSTWRWLIVNIAFKYKQLFSFINWISLSVHLNGITGVDSCAMAEASVKRFYVKNEYCVCLIWLTAIVSHCPVNVLTVYLRWLRFMIVLSATIFDFYSAYHLLTELAWSTFLLVLFKSLLISIVRILQYVSCMAAVT